MSRCRAIRDALPLFVGGDLAETRARAVRQHLRDCAACRREAAGLQQPLKRLRGLGAGAVDEAMFASLQDAIVERVAAEACGDALGERPRTHPAWWAAAAAAALVSFLVGWWVVRPAAGPALLRRAPIAMPVGDPGPSVVVPYAGPRVPLRLLGHEPGSGSAQGPGMMGRLRLRSLVEEAEDLPPPLAPSPR